MNSKKWVTIITFFCTILAIILLPIFRFCKCDIGYDISLAIFGSALLGFIMSLIEYFAERKKAMEQFWLESVRVLAQFRKAQYIKYNEPEELVVSCIAENYNNKLIQNDPTLASIMRITESHNNQKQFIQWMVEHEIMSFLDEDDTNIILNDIYLNRIESYEKLIKNVIDNYTELSQISLSALDSAYGNLNFIFANKTIRQTAYDEILNKIRTIKDNLRKRTFHFNQWKEGNGHFITCIDEVVAISKMLFSEEKTTQHEIENICVYQKQFDDIDESLEDFRTKIYFNSEADPINRICVATKTVKLKNNE